MRILSERTKIIRMALIRIGIQCDLMGFEYLSDGVEIIIDHPNKILKAKDLVRLIAEKHNNEGIGTIDTNMQHAINVTYNNRGFNEINELFGIQVIKPDHKPSILELVNLLAIYYSSEIYLGLPEF